MTLVADTVHDTLTVSFAAGSQAAKPMNASGANVTVPVVAI